MTNIKIYSAETNADAGIFVTLGTMTVGENADQVIAEFEHCELIDT